MKTKTFPIRLTPAEHAEIKAAADRSERSMSRFFVVAALRWAEIERTNADLNHLQTPADAGQNRKG